MKATSRKTKSKKLLIMSAVAGVVLFLIGLSFYLRQTTVNLAEKQAYSVEQSLIKMSATRLVPMPMLGAGGAMMRLGMVRHFE